MQMLLSYTFVAAKIREPTGSGGFAVFQHCKDFIERVFTGTLPFRPNSTEDGRRLNRRTEIRQTSLTIPTMYYRRVLQEVEDYNKAEAFSCLSKWISKSEKGLPMLLFFDPRLDYLRSDKRWALMEKQVRDTYNSLQYPKESFLIDSLRLGRKRKRLARVR